MSKYRVVENMNHNSGEFEYFIEEYRVRFRPVLFGVKPYEAWGGTVPSLSYKTKEKALAICERLNKGKVIINATEKETV